MLTLADVIKQAHNWIDGSQFLTALQIEKQCLNQWCDKGQKKYSQIVFVSQERVFWWCPVCGSYTMGPLPEIICVSDALAIPSQLTFEPRDYIQFMPYGDTDRFRGRHHFCPICRKAYWSCFGHADRHWQEHAADQGKFVAKAHFLEELTKVFTE